MQLWNVANSRPLGPPLQHEVQVRFVAFSPDGKTLLTSCSGGDARLWTVFPPVEGAPERVVLWTEVITGMELDAQGLVRVLNAPTRTERSEELDLLGGPPGR